LFSPNRVFARVEDVPAYAWALVVLLTSVTLIGWATIQSGLIDREVDLRVQQRIAELEKQQRDVVERSTLSKLIEDERKAGEFVRLMTRAQVIVAQPLKTLAVVLLLSSMIYGIVALTGKKPEWHTLITVFVFASFADVLGALCRLIMMLQLRTLDVDTSLGTLARTIEPGGGFSRTAAAGMAGFLTAFDPFRLWFWVIVLVGLSRTSQLRGWKLGAACVFCWLSAAGVRAAFFVANLSNQQTA
jgi:hypothetical protein